MKTIFLLATALLWAGCTSHRSTSASPETEWRTRIVGGWTGGGALIPIHHTFSEDGTYVQEVPSDGKRVVGKWSIAGNKLKRSFDNGDTVVEIVRFDEGFLQIRIEDGSVHSYHRKP